MSMAITSTSIDDKMNILFIQLDKKIAKLIEIIFQLVTLSILAFGDSFNISIKHH